MLETIKMVHILPKFDGKGKTDAFLHIHKCELKFKLINNLEANLACGLFSLTFEGCIQ
jgi:hypothetical protein